MTYDMTCCLFLKIRIDIFLISLKPHKNFETAMPYLWNYCNRAITPTEWCYDNQLCGPHTWAAQYPVGLSILSGNWNWNWIVREVFMFKYRTLPEMKLNKWYTIRVAWLTVVF